MTPKHETPKPAQDWMSFDTPSIALINDSTDSVDCAVLWCLRCVSSLLDFNLVPHKAALQVIMSGWACHMWPWQPP